MNAEVTFRDEQGDHTVKLVDFENLGSFVRGRQKIRGSFVRRTIGAPEVVNIKELPKTKLKELVKCGPVRVMFHNGLIEAFDKIEVHPTNPKHLICTSKLDEDEEGPVPVLCFQASCPVTILFD